MKRVLIVDSHPLMREALRMMVRLTWPKVALNEAGDMLDLDAVCRPGAAIDLVVMDPCLPGATGLSALILLKQRLPQTPVVIFSARSDDQMVGLSNALGAAAYLHKSAGMSELADCFDRALSGARSFPPLGEGAAVRPDYAGLRKRLDGLTATQLKVLIGVAGGRLNKQVAAELQVSEAAIKGHMTAIFRKLGVQNRAQAMLVVQPLLAAA